MMTTTMTVVVVMIIMHNFFQVFSVRVRDKGPDYRGFVQLPVVQASDADVLDSEAALITQTSALCFVDTCQRSFDASILKCHVSIYFNLVSSYYIMLEARCYVIWCGMDLEVMWIIMDTRRIQPLVCCLKILSSVSVMVYLFMLVVHYIALNYMVILNWKGSSSHTVWSIILRFELGS